jgi:hypothetical protein
MRRRNGRNSSGWRSIATLREQLFDALVDVKPSRDQLAIHSNVVACNAQAQLSACHSFLWDVS